MNTDSTPGMTGGSTPVVTGDPLAPLEGVTDVRVGAELELTTDVLREDRWAFVGTGGLHRGSRLVVTRVLPGAIPRVVLAVNGGEVATFFAVLRRYASLVVPEEVSPW